MTKTVAINTDHAPKPVGPYSQAVKTDSFLFISGQVPLNPQTGKLVEGSIAEQTKQIMNNIGKILAEAGLSHKDIVKTTIFLADMSMFQEMNQAYESYLSKPYPARSTVAVKGLPIGASLEIECIAKV